LPAGALLELKSRPLSLPRQRRFDKSLLSKQ
jgi:hypothetical protein